MFKSIKNTINSNFKKPEQIRVDGWQNIITNIGSKNSRTNSTFFRETYLLTKYTLNEIYKSNGLGKRIVNCVVEDSLRSFIECDKLLLKEINRVKTKQTILDVGCFGRLYGGAILVAFIDDGLPLDSPLNLKSINKLISFKVFDRYQVNWLDSDLCRDYFKEYYGEPEYYTITNNTILDRGVFFKVHRTRCFLFGGDRIPNSIKSNNSGWEISVIQSCYEALKSHGLVIGASAEIIQDFIQVIMKMTGLSEKMAREGGDAEVIKRIQSLDMSRSVANLLLLDGDGAEDYEKKSSSVSGLADLWDRFSENICAVTGIPATRLFGKSPSGLNSTGQSDMQNWYDIVRSYRADQVEPCINWIIDILKSQKEWRDKPKSYEWEFPSLTAPSEVEWAEIKKKHAEIDAIYIDRGGIDAAEAWQERFGKNNFHINIQLSKPVYEDVLQVEEENIDLTLVGKEEEKENQSEDDKKVNKIINDLYEKIEKNG